MATKEIVDLKPQNVWRNFYKLTRIPRPTGHMKEITKFMMEFGKSLDLETLQDRAGNVLIRKPASKGYEGKQTVILQAHLDMVPQQNSDIRMILRKTPSMLYRWRQGKGPIHNIGADNGIGVAMIMAVLEDKSLQHPLLKLFLRLMKKGVWTGLSLWERVVFRNALCLISIPTRR